MCFICVFDMLLCVFMRACIFHELLVAYGPPAWGSFSKQTTRSSFLKHVNSAFCAFSELLAAYSSPPQGLFPKKKAFLEKLTCHISECVSNP